MPLGPPLGEFSTARPLVATGAGTLAPERGPARPVRPVGAAFRPGRSFKPPGPESGLAALGPEHGFPPRRTIRANVTPVRAENARRAFGTPFPAAALGTEFPATGVGTVILGRALRPKVPPTPIGPVFFPGRPGIPIGGPAAAFGTATPVGRATAPFGTAFTPERPPAAFGSTATPVGRAAASFWTAFAPERPAAAFGSGITPVRPGPVRRIRIPARTVELGRSVGTLRPAPIPIPPGSIAVPVVVGSRPRECSPLPGEGTIIPAPGSTPLEAPGIPGWPGRTLVVHLIIPQGPQRQGPLTDPGALQQMQGLGRQVGGQFH